LFPFGYDDNGIASELLTEQELDIHHSDYSRREFQEKCREVCVDYEESFTEELQSLGVSVDWSRTYKTIEPRVQRTSQLSFIDLYDKGREYRERAPTIWCPDCETAISQVEMEEEKRDSEFVDVAFTLAETGSEPPADPQREESAYPVPTAPGDEVVISTTRPELLPACVAMFVHPDDDANQHLVGGTCEVPLFGHEVPIYADDRVEADTGTGIVMCCTFGDQTDIEWYQAHDLDLRVAIDESATMTELAGDYEGLSTEAARAAIKEDLDDEGTLLARDPIDHVVQVHERSCDAAVEYLVTEQWYVEMLDHTEEYLEAGREMEWYPEKMFSRYEHWIEGLEWDSVPGVVLRRLQRGDSRRAGATPGRPHRRRPVRRRLSGLWPRRVRTRGGRVRHVGDLLAHPVDQRRLGVRRGDGRDRLRRTRPVPDRSPAAGPRHRLLLAVPHGRQVCRTHR